MMVIRHARWRSAALLAWLMPGAAAGAPAPPSAPALSSSADSTRLPPGHQACEPPGVVTGDPWGGCHAVVTAQLALFRASGHTDLRPLRDARDLVLRFVSTPDAARRPTCAGTPPIWAQAPCGLLKNVFSMDELPPAEGQPGERRPPVWWDELKLGEQLYQSNRLDEAALHLREAYDLCDRQQKHDPGLCMPLLREMLDLRRVAAGARSDRANQDRAHQDRADSLAMLDRGFKATGRTCKVDPDTVFEELCEHRRALYYMQGEAHLDSQLYREAADDFELAYRTCTELGRQTLGCWASFGRAAWRARQHELRAIHTAETTQLNRARDLLEHFIRDDMHRTCDDAGLPDAVQGACQDLKALALAVPAKPGQPNPPGDDERKRQPVFVAALVIPGPLSKTVSQCTQNALLPTACWPEVRARALDLSQAALAAAPEESTKQLRELQRDMAAYVRAAGIRCERPKAPPEVCAQVQQIDDRLAAAAVVTTLARTSGPARTFTPPTKEHDDRPDRRLRTAGTVSLALGGASLVLTGVGMYLGSQATRSGEEGRAEDPSRGAQSVRDDSVFVRGENANKLVVGSAIVGGTLLATGVVLLVVDPNPRPRGPGRLSLRLGGAALSF